MRNNKKIKKREHYPPSNVSVSYYTDPIYSTDAFYGFEDDVDETQDENIPETVTTEKRDAPDEPVESWGWINNVDNRQF